MAFRSSCLCRRWVSHLHHELSLHEQKVPTTREPASFALTPRLLCPGSVRRRCVPEGVLQQGHSQALLLGFLGRGLGGTREPTFLINL